MVSQVLQGAELTLLDCSFASSKFLGNVLNTALVHESTPDDVALIFRQAIDQLGKDRLSLCLLRHAD